MFGETSSNSTIRNSQPLEISHAGAEVRLALRFKFCDRIHIGAPRRGHLDTSDGYLQLGAGQSIVPEMTMTLIHFETFQS